MQPKRHDVEIVGTVPSTGLVLVARERWFDGNFEECLALLDQIPPRPRNREAVFLRARALLRLNRYAEVEALLEDQLGEFDEIDERCTAEMLHANAVTRTGSVQRGLDLLERVSATADTFGAHPTIRAEIAYTQALAHWTCRDAVSALHFARIAQNASADIVSARAVQLRGYIAMSERKHDEALRFFRAALEYYRRCSERDTYSALLAELNVAGLELMLRSVNVTGSHDRPFSRDATRSATSPTLAGLRSRTMIADAWLFAHDGDRVNAFRLARQATELAPNERGLVWALAHRGAISHAFANTDDAREHGAQAFDTALRIDWSGTSNEDRIGLLILAELLASLDSEMALTVFERYQSSAPAVIAGDAFGDDPRLEGIVHHVTGLMLRLQRRPVKAHHELDAAYRIFRQTGYLWRAAIALIELDATPVAGAPRGNAYIEAAAHIIRENFPRSFLVRRIGRWMTAHDDPFVAKLTPAKCEILRYLLDGWSAKRIASVKGRSEGSIRNNIAAILAACGVHSIQELIVECYRRGLGVASWRDEFDPTMNAEPGATSSPERRRASH